MTQHTESVVTARGLRFKHELKHAVLTDVGRKRSQNQDNLLCLPELGVFVVADGMGGHQGGETASATAVSTIESFFSTHPNLFQDEAPLLLREAILRANEAIQKKAKQAPELQGMGTTCVGLYFRDDSVFVGHVGDSRCYLLQGKKIWQITRDHSLVQERLRAGLITREGVKTDRLKNVITRSVGFEADVDVDIYRHHVVPGDLILICSDGLTGMLEDAELSTTIDKMLTAGESLSKVTSTLIDLANENGGDDNVTALLVQVV